MKDTFDFSGTQIPRLFFANCAAPTALPEGGFWRRLTSPSEAPVKALTGSYSDRLVMVDGVGYDG